MKKVIRKIVRKISFSKYQDFIQIIEFFSNGKYNIYYNGYSVCFRENSKTLFEWKVEKEIKYGFIFFNNVINILKENNLNNKVFIKFLLRLKEENLKQEIKKAWLLKTYNNSLLIEQLNKLKPIRIENFNNEIIKVYELEKEFFLYVINNIHITNNINEVKKIIDVNIDYLQITYRNGDTFKKRFESSLF